MYFLDRMTIKSKLIAAFMAITVVLIFFGSFILIEMETLGDLTTTLYEHPLRVSNAAQSAHKRVLRIQSLMKDIIYSKNEIDLQEQMANIQQGEKEVLEQLNIVQKYILGEQGRALEDDVRRTFFKWKNLRIEIISLLREHKREEALQKFQLENADMVNVIELNMQGLTAYARNKADGFMSDANKARENITFNTIILLGLLVLFFYFVSSILIKNIIGRINDLQSTIYKITESGNLNEIEVIGDNELSKLAVSFNGLIRSLSSQLWLREGLNKLNDELTGASSPLLLAESVLKFLADHMQASTGAFFIYDEEKKNSSMLASYAMAESNKFSREFTDGDGIVGQVAKERSPKILTIVSRDEGLIQSGTVSRVPNTIFVSPLLFADNLLGVLEVTSFQEFGTVEQAFMKTACHNIATSLSNILQREEIDALYAEARIQNTELFNAGEKARKATEEIELRNTELRIRSEELKLQANLLSSQKKELEVKQVQVEAADRLKSEFLSNMSHELRTPLNSILALSQLMQIKGTGKDEKKEAEYLHVIERNGKHLLSLINDILDLSKIESGRMDLFLNNFSPAELLEDVSTTIRPMAERKSLSFIVKIDYYQSMFSDRDKIRQILLNLMSNAVKFSDKGTIEVLLTTEEEHLVLHVKDTGIGIAIENQEAIFDEFRQVDGSTSRKHEGTGLGLAICRKLANMLEGELKVASELGQGSTFTLRLPLRLADSGKTQSSSAEARNSESEHSLNTVLVVDDDPNSREIVMKHLVKAGYGVLEADNGKRALEIAANHSLVGIILDIFMPGMDGWETLNMLKKNPSTRDIPVIIVSISNDSTTGYVLGANAHLTKPVDKEQLLNEISKLKGQKPSQIQSILIVDDEENDRMLLSNTLREAGYDTIEADSGQSGLDKAVSLLPDVMTLDLLMPEMDGFQMLEKISKLPQLSYLPVIVITAKDLSISEHQKLLERSRAIVQKGDLDVKILLQKLENELDDLRRQKFEHSCEVKVLVIEDNDIATMQIARLLKELCFSMSHAACFQDAVLLAQQITPDLIILDLMISSFNVFKTFETIRSEPDTEHIPVIVLTGKDLSSEVQAVLKNRNVRQFNRKEPLDRELLKELILQSVNDGAKPAYVNLSGQKLMEIELPDNRFNKPFGKGKVIVVVEDNEDNVITLKAILEDFQGEIHVAYDGESGLKIIHEIRPDLVLMDIQLPGINGLEATSSIKKSQELAHIPVIAVTARAMKDDRKKIMEAGCDGLLTKPYDVENLRKILLKWLML
ncbi:response regulator [Desulfovibrio gilichinskyi]|uniref:histidine kinase n=1 Tax=Desulfovibrio gilichinskyi TaxID=1519643 RepID=A0A1X7E7B0_9BACT|nr:response regulator [Desulfovibrio gilichinskyi]SMF28870.1 GAF domain-containing protein [Desulfovibrio gilichinskyi]